MTDPVNHEDIIDIEPKVIGESTTSTASRKIWLRALPFVGLGLLCAIGGGWLYRDILAGYFPTEQTRSLTSRVAAIEASSKDNQKRVDAVVALTEELKAKLSGAQAASDKSAKLNLETATLVQGSANEITLLKQELEKISSATADVQARLASGASTTIGGDIDPALVTRLAQLEKQLNAAPAASTVGEIIDQTANLKSLKSQIAQGQAFATILAPLARALPAAPGLDVLGVERAGLVNAASLAAELDSLRVNLPKPSIQPDDSSWWGSFKGVFSKLVRVRGEPSEDWATAAAKASAFAVAGDLDQASSILTKGSTPAPAPLKAWADKAQRRMKLEKALDAFAASLTRAGLAKE